MKLIFIKLLICICCVISLSSCSNDGRKVKKFLSRMNAREINAASKYIYPGDHAKLKIYAEVLEKNPNLFLKLKKKKNVKCNGIPGVVATFECKNSSPYYHNYMENLHLLQPSGMVVDTFYIRETLKGDKLSFNWANIKGENLKLATIRDSTIKSINIREDMGENYPIIGKVKAGQSVVIDDYSENPKWVKCFTTDDNCRIVEGYIYRELLSANENVFFSLGIFESLGITLAVIIFVVVGIGFVLVSALSKALIAMNPWGFIPAVVMILGLLYVLYQLLENILFELFIINLPY
ncbi:SH3 domain-containing protein [Odoribacter lunatus]|uniref:SH3 domain-containing protein n=1 Tax=Odoribacter lunatus TaxID=2941335 RepID=UPI00203C735F|nr:SH3 domain-containing protein [Odoribacter lunatus]